MYGQYTSASDYFTVRRTKASVKSIVNAFTSTNMDENDYPQLLLRMVNLMMVNLMDALTIKVFIM